MKTLQKFFFILFIAISCTAINSSAQIVVRVRPVVPHYVRVAAPSPRHVWIDEEWEPRGGSYVFVGGHWALPPQPGLIWRPGHWRNSPRGWIWIPGHWAHRRW